MKTADLKIAEPYVVTRGFPNGLVYPIRNTVWSKRTRTFGAESQFEPGKRDFADKFEKQHKPRAVNIRKKLR